MLTPLLLAALAAPAAPDLPDVPQPAPTKADEPMAPAYSPAKAAAYLDGVGVNWTRDRQCITCHTNMPYLLARPVLPGDAGWKEVRAFLEKDVESWQTGGKPRGEAYVVATAFALAFNDARKTGQLHPATRAALDRMWKGQKATGEWNWLKCNWPPMEHDDYYGATVAAVAAGIAPGGYAKTDAAVAGLDKLRAYFQKTPAPDLHHRAMLLWASARVPGLMTPADQKATVAELKGLQHADGGWSLPALGKYNRRDGTPNDPQAPSDGYGTGFVVFVLREAGVAADDAAIQKGAAWLKANQRASGRWFTRSLNNDKAHYITNAGTAFAVLALDACRVSADVPAAPAGTAPAGFTPLFNGKDLAGWHGWAIHGQGGKPDELAKTDPEERAKRIEAWTADSKKHWRVENGELVNDGHGAYLATEKEYGDIELLIEYKTVPGADSGIYLRNTPQVQIWDSNQKFDPKNPTRKPHLGSGGLFNNTPDAPGRDPLVLADRPFGEWNQFRIIQVGERTTVYLNGKLVVEPARMENYWNRKLPLPKTGKILLQTHGGEIRWRNLLVREIPPAEANKILMSQGAAGFEPVFNGTDFTGWAGPLDNYEVLDGAIVCKPKKGGNIYTTEQFADFAVRLEYRLPPGGNNGLAIRSPGGKAHVATEAMCEVQILDDTAKQYEKLDPRQYNGSVYGMIAAQRGYLRPVGEWNVMEVTVKGPTIRVELNGTRILDGDVSQVTEFKDKQPHPGKDRPSGHFGFAGHNDPVAFRNIRIKKLDAK